MRQYFCKLLAVCIALFSVNLSAYAALAVNLSHPSEWQAVGLVAFAPSWKQISVDRDFKQVTHTRLQQTYLGYPVWGGEAVMHVANGSGNQDKTYNGIAYQGLEADLHDTPQYIFNKTQSDKALQQAILYHQEATDIQSEVSDAEVKMVVYIDQNSQAHWAFHISFVSKSHQGLAEKPSMVAKPNYILDAISLSVYQSWDNIQTFTHVWGGGYGGNIKAGKQVYDELSGDYPKLEIQRDTQNKMCYLKNEDDVVLDASRDNTIVHFPCTTRSSQHNSVYWDADQGAVNGAYSPENDALYIGKIIKSMYQKWYGLSPLIKSGKPMLLKMVVHYKMENAFWDGEKMVFGDGGEIFYPLVSLSVGAHEISHGFTAQHSNLAYYGQSGGLNESFSDMAAAAAEFYATGHNRWQLGPEIVKYENTALRYMDEPTKDCLPGHRPGDDCSISHIKDYRNDLNVHNSSGVFNKLFYLMSTAKDWDTKKAFDVMVQANIHYWTSTASFVQAACGVIKATEDYGYRLAAVTQAMAEVGINTAHC